MGAAPGVEADRHARPYRRAGSKRPLHVEVRRRFPIQGRIGTSLPILRSPSRANGEARGRSEARGPAQPSSPAVPPVDSSPLGVPLSPPFFPSLLSDDAAGDPDDAP